MDTLRSSYNHYPQGDLDAVLGTLKALHDTGVDVLVGTDASFPLPFLGGVAHGASVHHELQYFVCAGIAPVGRCGPPPPARLDGSRSPIEGGSNPACVRTSCSSVATRPPTFATR
jgi:hypothetical protein